MPEGGTTGHEVAASPDGRLAYVPIYGNSGVGKAGTDGHNMVVIDIAQGKVVHDVDFGHGVRPHCAVFGPKDGMLYVTTELDKTISVIDPKTLKIIGVIPTDQPESHMLALSHDGRRGYTANVGPGTVSVLDMEARKTIKVIPISKETQRISVSPDDKWIFTSDQTKPQLAVIDASSGQVTHWVPLPGTGYGTASTVDGRYLLVAVPPVNKVAVVDLQEWQVVHTIDVPRAPQEVLVRPDGKVADVRAIPVTRLPPSVSPSGNSTSSLTRERELTVSPGPFNSALTREMRFSNCRLLVSALCFAFGLAAQQNIPNRIRQFRKRRTRAPLLSNRRAHSPAWIEAASFWVCLRRLIKPPPPAARNLRRHLRLLPRLKCHRRRRA